MMMFTRTARSLSKLKYLTTIQTIQREIDRTFKTINHVWVVPEGHSHFVTNIFLLSGCGFLRLPNFCFFLPSTSFSILPQIGIFTTIQTIPRNIDRLFKTINLGWVVPGGRSGVVMKSYGGGVPSFYGES